MDLDFKTDADDLFNYMVSRTEFYEPDDKQGPGKINDPVSMAYAGYEFDQAGWFVLVFDRRPEAAHDGEWTRYIDKAPMLERKNWVVARDKNESRAIKVRGEDGKITEWPAGSNFGQLLGRMIVEVLQRAEREREFTRLPLAEGFRLGLEEFNGSLGWDSKTGFGGEPS